MGISKSRQLIKGLRHNPIEIFGMDVDLYGYIDVNVVLKRLDIDKNELQRIHDTNDKRRFEFNSNKSKIRATQGHTIPIILDLDFVRPPDLLYHRTHKKFLSSIFDSGLSKMKRHHVHLTENQFLNKTKEIILEIDSKKMHNDGFKFLKTSNDVWLTETVPSIYIKEVSLKIDIINSFDGIKSFTSK